MEDVIDEPIKETDALLETSSKEQGEAKVSRIPLCVLGAAEIPTSQCAKGSGSLFLK